MRIGTICATSVRSPRRPSRWSRPPAPCIHTMASRIVAIVMPVSASARRTERSRDALPTGRIQYTNSSRATMIAKAAPKSRPSSSSNSKLSSNSSVNVKGRTSMVSVASVRSSCATASSRSTCTLKSGVVSRKTRRRPISEVASVVPAGTSWRTKPSSSPAPSSACVYSSENAASSSVAGSSPARAAAISTGAR